MGAGGGGLGVQPLLPPSRLQSPAHKGPALGGGAPGGSARAGLLLLCLNAAHLLTRRHPLLGLGSSSEIMYHSNERPFNNHCPDF